MSTTTPLRPHDADDDLGDAWGWRAWSGRTRTAVAVTVVVVLAVAAAWVVAFSSAFGVRSIDVRGVHNLTSADVLARAHITRGTPLVRVDTAAITVRLDQLPDIASAEVSTSFPSTVVITVVERSPVGYLEAAGGDTLVDRTGAAYRVVTSAPKTLPKMVVSTSRATRAAVARVAGALPRRLLAEVKSIQALDPNAITLVLTGGRVVLWGSDTRSSDKARILPVLLRKDDQQFDVSNPDLPFSH